MAASITLEYLKDMQLHSSIALHSRLVRLYNKSLNIVSITCLSVFLLLALSRSILLIKG